MDPRDILCLSDAGRHTEALREARALVRQHADSASSWILLGQVAVAASNWGEAKYALERAAQLSQSLEALQALGELLRTEHGKLVPSTTTRARRSETQVPIAAAHFAVANGYGLLGDEEKAMSHLDAAIKADPTYREALYALGYSQAKSGQYGEAMKAFTSIAAADPDDRDAWLGLGLAAYHLADHHQAEQALSRALELGHDNPNVRGLLCCSCAAQGHFELSVEHGELSLLSTELPKEVATVRRCLAWSYRALSERAEAAGDCEGAVILSDRACVASPDESVNWYVLGRLLAECGRWRAAAAPLRKALKLGYDELAARRALVSVLFEGEEYAEACREAERCLRLDFAPPERAWLHEILASGYRILGNTGESLRNSESAASLAPQDADAAYNLGVTYLQQSRFGEAVRQLEHALDLEVDASARGQIITVLAQALVGAGEFKRAESALRGLMGTDHHDAGLALLIDLLVSHTRLDEALAIARHEMEARPAAGLSHACLGYVLLHLEQDEIAHQHLTTARKLQSADPWVEWLTQGRLLKENPAEGSQSDGQI